MKNTLIIIMLLALSSCEYEPDGRTHGAGIDFDIIEIEGCEYISRDEGNRGWMAHKGNCKSPIHN